MKKVILLLSFCCTVMILIGCNQTDLKNSSATMTSSVSRTTTNSQTENIFVSEEFVAGNESQMAEFVIELTKSKDTNQEEYQIETQSQNGIYIYSPTIPEGFYCSRNWLNGSYIYYRYENQYLTDLKESGNVSEYVRLSNTISLKWAFKADGEIALQYDIEFWNEQGWPVNEIANKQGYYYIDCDVYQNYFWCEDGYAFGLQIPKSVGSVDLETHEYSGEDVFTLKKTFYPFDDDNVAE